MKKQHRSIRKGKAFQTGAGIPSGHPVAFHTNARHIPVNQIGSGAAGADTAFNKSSTTGGVYSIGTPLSGKNANGKWRRMGRKQGY